MPDDRDLPIVRSLDDLSDLVESRGPLYIRYSRGPERDPPVSRDYESGLVLPGISANPLNPERWWTRPLREWLARQLCQYAHLRDEASDDRRAWVLTGPVVARGPDSEPLIDPVTPVALLDDELIEEAKELYHRAFEVGKDSTS